MKTRAGFVSNSSSSSFIINKNYLSQIQIDKIKNYKEERIVINNLLRKARDYYNDDDYFTDIEPDCVFLDEDDSCPWSITEDENIISGFTIVDNFDMSLYFDYIGINKKYIRWSG